MAWKLIGAVLSVAVMVAFCLAPVFKLKDVALSAVLLIGLTMMLVDLWQSLRSKDS